MSREIQVRKRDNTLELFDKKNVFNVVKAAGLSDADANTVSDRIEKWLDESGVTEISSLTIRDKVLEVLTTVNQDVADLYRWYESTKKDTIEPGSSTIN